MNDKQNNALTGSKNPLINALLMIGVVMMIAGLFSTIMINWRHIEQKYVKLLLIPLFPLPFLGIALLAKKFGGNLVRNVFYVLYMLFVPFSIRFFITTAEIDLEINQMICINAFLSFLVSLASFKLLKHDLFYLSMSVCVLFGACAVPYCIFPNFVDMKYNELLAGLLAILTAILEILISNYLHKRYPETITYLTHGIVLTFAFLAIFAISMAKVFVPDTNNNTLGEQIIFMFFKWAFRPIVLILATLYSVKNRFPHIFIMTSLLMISICFTIIQTITESLKSRVDIGVNVSLYGGAIVLSALLYVSLHTRLFPGKENSIEHKI